MSSGLDSEILQLQWPSGCDPARLPNFETQARRKRYRILARAAIRCEVQSLYLGHHQDDQVENFLMRLTRSDHGRQVPPGTALLGMRTEASIPCCNDIYGAFERESDRVIPDDSRVHLAEHGLSLVRPFLGYSKARLQATCESLGVQYFTDKTNLDPTSTRRNTIRYLLSNHRLPYALQRKSLIERHARIKEKVSTSGETYRASLWRLLKISNFDTRSGSLLVHFPEQSDLGSDEDAFASVAYVLTELLDAVSPKPRGTIAVSADIVNRVIDGLYQQKDSKRFVTTFAGLLLDSSSRTLRLSREPIRSTDRSILTKIFIAAIQEPFIHEQWTEWLFWDNRYWLRIRIKPSENADEFSVRAYTGADVVSVFNRLRNMSSYALKTFKDAIEAAAPGRTKFTLPVITKGGIVVAFPTLNMILSGSFDHNCGENCLPGQPWQIRYKSQIHQLQSACLRDTNDSSSCVGLAASTGKALRYAV